VAEATAYADVGRGSGSLPERAGTILGPPRADDERVGRDQRGMTFGAPVELWVKFIAGGRS
jgi:hypothetical protein